MKLDARSLIFAGVLTVGATGVGSPAHAAGAPVADLRSNDGTQAGVPALFLANIDDDAGVCKARAKKIVADSAADEAADTESYDAEEKVLRKEFEGKDAAGQAEVQKKWDELQRTHRLNQYRTDKQLAACNDAADTVVNGVRDQADLARLHVGRWVAAPDSATGTVTVPDSVAAHVNLFVKRSKTTAPLGWELITPDTRLTAHELRNGVEIGIEGRDIVRDSAVWDGKVTVRLTVTADGRSTSGTVALKQAPVLTQLNTQRLQEVSVAAPLSQKASGTGTASHTAGRDLTEVRLAAKLGSGRKGAGRTLGEGLAKALKSAKGKALLKALGGEPLDDSQDAYDSAIDAAVKANGLKPLRHVDTAGDQWIQDVFEPAYQSIPGPDGKPRGMRVLIPSVNIDKHAGSRSVFTEFVGPDVAGALIEHAPDDAENTSYDSMGNLEAIPPRPGFPAGQVIVGGEPGQKRKGPAAEMLTFLRSQGVQKPISLDTSWLTVGHVDEFIQFLPAPGTPRGWRAVVADPRAGMELLQDAKKAGQSGQPLLSGMSGLEEPYDQIVDRRNIDEFLADPQFVRVNERSAQKIDANLTTLKQQAGLTDADIVRVPTLFTARSIDYLLLQSAITQMEPGEEKTKAEAELAAMNQVVALVPDTVNGLVLNHHDYLAPTPHGPVINGKDVFTDAIDKAFGGIGYKVRYVEEFLFVHTWEGEIHCTTNSLRDVFAADQRWWRQLPDQNGSVKP
ncbi:protein-arginine deiminase family protein [Streptomyces sp. NPDC058459]|uniref:protein-arginine deiminase family protein n=1 Tax=Streptomyces sp. NPDC058459 TaxID=3346508 RepID=UPI0036617D70